MALYIQTNVASLNAQANLSKTTNQMQTTFARLSSGYRINSAADDAAGLGISTSMQSQVKSFSVAERNTNDAISMVQTADASAGQTAALLTRMRELSVQSMNGVMTTADRSNISTEFGSLTKEISRIANTTKFNSINIANASAVFKMQVGINTTSNDQISVTMANLTATGLSVNGLSVSSATGASSAVDAIDSALKTLSQKRATFGAALNRFDTTVANIQSMRTNLAAANSRIRDVDVAEETANLARQQVLSQAGSAVLAQSNQAPQQALSLLR